MPKGHRTVPKGAVAGFGGPFVSSGQFIKSSANNMKNSIRVLLFVMAFVLLLPQATYAAWWNPFTWRMSSQKVEVKIEPVEIASSTSSTKTATKEAQRPKEKIVPPAQKPKTDPFIEIEKLRKEVEDLKKKQEMAKPTANVTLPVTSVSTEVQKPVVESWESLETRNFIYADAQGWASMISTNGLGEKRYYRKEGTQWVRKNTEAEASQKYIDPKALENFNALMDALNKSVTDTKIQQQAVNDQKRRQLECLLKPTPPELRTLSPQQQQYIREQECGTATSQTDQNYKLYQEQQYRDCVIKNPSNYELSCGGLKPIFY